jgi:hypothetical protein
VSVALSELAGRGVNASLEGTIVIGQPKAGPVRNRGMPLSETQRRVPGRLDIQASDASFTWGS